MYGKHNLALEARTLEEARKLAEKDSLISHGITAAIVGGNLDNRKNRSCNDGWEICKRIKSAGLNITIALHTGFGEEDVLHFKEHFDTFLGKSGSSEALKMFLDSLS